MSPLRAVENTHTPISTSPENFSIAPIAACWKMSMRRSPFSAGSSIEPDTSITASMRERSVSTAHARRISSCAAASRSVAIAAGPSAARPGTSSVPAPSPERKPDSASRSVSARAASPKAASRSACAFVAAATPSAFAPAESACAGSLTSG